MKLKLFFLSRRNFPLFLFLMLFPFIGKAQVRTYYDFSQNTNGTYVELSSPNVLWSGTSWDDNVTETAVPIGFSFGYGGQYYTEAFVSSNGFITFGDLPATNNFKPISNNSAYNGAVVGFGADLRSNGSNSSISYRTLGTAPNRRFVVQYKNFRRYTTLATGEYNFQIILHETTRRIDVVYGTCGSGSLTTVDIQVGLRGYSNADFNNRATTVFNNWDNTTSGVGNDSTMPTLFLVGPSSGLTYTWIPKAPATIDYIENFESSPTFWGLVNGTETNKWWAGSEGGVNNGGVSSLYISNTGSTNSYSNTTSVVHAFREITVPTGATVVDIDYDWRSNGDTAGGDYLRVWVVPQDFGLFPGLSITPGTNRILLKTHRGRNTFAREFNSGVNVSAFAGKVMRLVFEWTNDNATSVQSAAAIDNLNVWIRCSGTPAGGTATATPTTGLPSSPFTVSVAGSTVASGLAYQWQVSEDGGITWSDIPGQTAEILSINAVSSAGTSRHYRRKTICTYNSQVGYSTIAVFTTTSPEPCNAYTTSSPTSRVYINSVAFVGAMVNPPVNTSEAGVSGYSNYKVMPVIVQQAQGEGVNVKAKSNTRGRWKAWIDWNGNGVFDTNEIVYNSTATIAITADFGFSVPTWVAPGRYVMRIRVNNGYTGSSENYGFDFGPCDNFSTSGNNAQFGETEDYSVQVVRNCEAKITQVVSAPECNSPGGINFALSANSNIPVQEFRWYTSLTGGSYVTSLPDETGKSTIFTTPLLSSTTKYYVTAFNGVCESTFRVEVVAEMKPTPQISFNPPNLSICGEAQTVEVSAVGDLEVVHLVAKQTFEDGTLGVFTNQNVVNNGAAVNAKTMWTNRASVYIPTLPNYYSWYPAISSGFGSNRFVSATSDIGLNPQNNAYSINHLLNSPTDLDTRGLSNLTLKMRVFLSRYQPDNSETLGEEFLSVEVSTNGTIWTTIDSMKTDVGEGTAFAEKVYNLDNYVGNQAFRFRIRYRAGQWFDGVAIDDVELYGERPLAPSFVWNNPNIGIYSNAAGTLPYQGGPISKVYLKPTEQQIEQNASWQIIATALLTNSCTATGLVTINNDTKVRNTANTNWSSLAWLPTTQAPTADKCVVIKTPVTLASSGVGQAKNVRVKPGGTLTISANAALTVQEDFINEGVASNVLVQNNGSLIQVQNVVNTTPITVRRNFTLSNGRQEYNYVSSPVAGQDMKLLFGDLAANTPYVLKLNEMTGYFVNANAADYAIKGKGFAIKETRLAYNANGTGLLANQARFQKVPNNGDINVDLNFSNTLTGDSRGFNVVGNPYPSGVLLTQLYADSGGANSGINSTFKFWDNTVNATYQQMGTGYTMEAYAYFNASSGVGNPAPGLDVISTGGETDAGFKVPSNVLPVGQAFMVRATGPGAVLRFKNSQRVNQPLNTQLFFGKTDESMDLFRLQLVDDANFAITNTIRYYSAGDNSYDIGDSPAKTDAVRGLYTMAGDQQVVINARYSFVDSDKVAVGYKIPTNGTFKFRTFDRLGIFENQKIFIKDKLLGVVADITDNEYSFVSNNGEFSNRFEIVYKPDATLDVTSHTKNKIAIYRSGSDFVIDAFTRTISTAEVYDSSGKLILTKSIDSSKGEVDGDVLINGVYILKLKMNDGEIVSQKIRK